MSLRDLTWWKIGGAADFYCQPKSIDDIRDALQFARSRGLPVTVLGGGTNVLVSDRGVEGLVIGMKSLAGASVTEADGKIRVTAFAGTPKSELTKIFLKRKLAPALFLCGLPGDVGGGVVMNAGVGEMITPREFVEIVEWVEFIDFNDQSLKRVARDELRWTYRHTDGWQPGIIVRAGIVWDLKPDDSIPRQVTEATKLRRSRQPLELPSCGSTFKNPDGGKAGALIEKAGLKGYVRGGAQVSEKHANFIVNKGGATAADVDHIIHHVQSEVKLQFGVDLHCEVKYLGRW